MMNQNARIIVVDDDQRLRQLLEQYLTDRGFSVQTACDATQALHLLKTQKFDAMILDVMMPGEDGLAFTKRLKQDFCNTPANNTPILLLTAMGDADDRIAGLEHGADDYLCKPFEPKELLLRLQTILRRHHAISPPPKVLQTLKLGKFTFDSERGMLYADDQPVNLTFAEAQLLTFLARHHGQPVSRDDLAKHGGVNLSPRTIDVQVTRLRKKIEVDPRQPRYIKTVRHKGYILWAD